MAANQTETQPFEGVNQYVQTLQPHKDLSSNWSIDLAGMLDDYMQYLAQVVASDSYLRADGQTNINFAEAGLVVQGSAGVCCRKVDYLHVLTLQRRDFVAQRTITEAAELSTQQDGTIVDMNEYQEESTLLALDNIEIASGLDRDGGEEPSGPQTTAPRAPEILLSVEEELQGGGSGVSGLSADVAEYKLVTCRIHRSGALLLQGNDSFSPDCPSYEAEAGPIGDDGLGQRNVRGGDAYPLGSDDFDDDGGGNHDEDYYVPECGAKHKEDDMDLAGKSRPWDTGEEDGTAAEKHGTFGAGKQQTETQAPEEVVFDPWAPLDPHEESQLPKKPFVKGRCLLRCSKRKKAAVQLVRDFPLWSLSSVTNFPELIPVRQQKMALEAECTGRRRKSHKPQYQWNAAFDGPAPLDMEEDEMNEVGGDDYAADAVSDDDFSDHQVPDWREAAKEATADFFSEAQKGMDDGDNTVFEQSAGGMPSSSANYHQDNSGVEARVSVWHANIGPVLEEQDKRPEFDIHVYGERVLMGVVKGEPIQSALRSSTASGMSRDRSDGGAANGPVTFTVLMQGQPQHEVSRLFSSMLQLVNNRNIDINRGDRDGGACCCFTADHPFKLSMLSQHRPHEDMLCSKALASQPGKGATAKKSAKAPCPAQPSTEPGNGDRDNVINATCMESPSRAETASPVVAAAVKKAAVKSVKEPGLVTPPLKHRQKKRQGQVLERTQYSPIAEVENVNGGRGLAKLGSPGSLPFKTPDGKRRLKGATKGGRIPLRPIPAN